MIALPVPTGKGSLCCGADWSESEAEGTCSNSSEKLFGLSLRESLEDWQN